MNPQHSLGSAKKSHFPYLPYLWQVGHLAPYYNIPVTHTKAPMLAPRMCWLAQLPCHQPCSYLLSLKPARFPHCLAICSIPQGVAMATLDSFKRLWLFSVYHLGVCHVAISYFQQTFFPSMEWPSLVDSLCPCLQSA